MIEFLQFHSGDRLELFVFFYKTCFLQLDLNIPDLSKNLICLALPLAKLTGERSQADTSADEGDWRSRMMMLGEDSEEGEGDGSDGDSQGKGGSGDDKAEDDPDSAESEEFWDKEYGEEDDGGDNDYYEEDWDHNQHVDGDEGSQSSSSSRRNSSAKQTLMGGLHMPGEREARKMFEDQRIQAQEVLQ